MGGRTMMPVAAEGGKRMLAWVLDSWYKYCKSTRLTGV